MSPSGIVSACAIWVVLSTFKMPLETRGDTIADRTIPTTPLTSGTDEIRRVCQALWLASSCRGLPKGTRKALTGALSLTGFMTTCRTASFSSSRSFAPSTLDGTRNRSALCTVSSSQRANFFGALLMSSITSNFMRASRSLRAGLRNPLRSNVRSRNRPMDTL